jgi:hypothetical protein
MQQGRLTVRGPRLCDQVTGAERVWAALTLWYGIATSLQCRQFGWFTAFLASGCLGLVGLVYTIPLFVSPNAMLGGIRLEDLITVAPFLPGCGAGWSTVQCLLARLVDPANLYGTTSCPGRLPSVCARLTCGSVAQWCVRSDQAVQSQPFRSPSSTSVAVNRDRASPT